MNWEETYLIIAKEISETITDRTHDYIHLKNVLNAVIDLSTSLSGSAEGYGKEASVRLLQETFTLYKVGLNTYFFAPERSKFVESVNDFTVRYFGDLAEFVNSLNWDNGTVSSEWKNLSGENGRDTSNWV